MIKYHKWSTPTLSNHWYRQFFDTPTREPSMTPKQAINYLQNLADHGAAELKDAVAVLRPLATNQATEIHAYVPKNAHLGWLDCLKPGAIIDTGTTGDLIATTSMMLGPSPVYPHPDKTFIWCGDTRDCGTDMSCFVSADRKKFEYWTKNCNVPCPQSISKSGWCGLWVAAYDVVTKWLADNPMPKSSPACPCSDYDSIWCGDTDYLEGHEDRMSCYITTDRTKFTWISGAVDRPQWECIHSYLSTWNEPWRRCHSVIAKWLKEHPLTAKFKSNKTDAIHLGDFTDDWMQPFSCYLSADRTRMQCCYQNHFWSTWQRMSDFRNSWHSGWRICHKAATEYMAAHPLPQEKPERACIIYVPGDTYHHFEAWLHRNGYQNFSTFDIPERNCKAIRIFSELLPSGFTLPSPGQYFCTAVLRICGGRWSWTGGTDLSTMEPA